jgi:hypothetical protein
MILSDISITRPVLAAVLSLLLIAFGLDAFDRRHDTEIAVIVEAEITILRPGIEPRDHEYGEALFGQVFHHRIVR